MSRLPLLLAGLLACTPGDPVDPGTTTSSSSTESSDTGAPPPTTGGAITTTTSGFEPTTTGASSSTTGASSTTDDATTGHTERCGDGVVDPGDLCFLPPAKVGTPEEVLKWVASHPGGIGFLELSKADARVRVVHELSK